MPQVKGSTTWWTNLRQCPETPRFIGIDNSDVYLENDQAEEAMKKQLDDLHLHSKRVLADRLLDVHAARRDVDKYRRIQDSATRDNINAIIEQRKHQQISDVSLTSLGKSSNSGQKKGTDVAQRPKTSGPLPVSRRGFSRVDIDDSDEDDYFQRRKLEARLSSTVLEPTTTALPTRSRRRTRKPRPARSIRQIREALSEEFSGPPTQNPRPHTTLGFVREESLHSGSSQPGRDIAELSRIRSAYPSRRREQQVRVRQQHLTREKEQIQHRINNFYVTLEEFKKDFRENRPKSRTFLYS